HPTTISTPFTYTTHFRSIVHNCGRCPAKIWAKNAPENITRVPARKLADAVRPRCFIHRNMNAAMAKTWSAIDQLIAAGRGRMRRSEEHTSELQSQSNIVC